MRAGSLEPCIKGCSSGMFRKSFVQIPRGSCSCSLLLCGWQSSWSKWTWTWAATQSEISKCWQLFLLSPANARAGLVSSVVLLSRLTARLRLYLQDAWVLFFPTLLYFRPHLKRMQNASWLIARSHCVPILLCKWFAGIFCKWHTHINLMMVPTHAALWGLILANL